MIYAFIMLKKREDSKSILFWDMLIKLCNIPINIMLFLVGTLLTIGAFIFGGWVVGLGTAIINYMLLIPSTMYGISGLIRAKNENKLNTATVLLNCVLHFIFCLDVISAIVMYIKIRSDYKKIEMQKNYIEM